MRQNCIKYIFVRRWEYYLWIITVQNVVLLFDQILSQELSLHENKENLEAVAIFNTFGKL